MRLHHATRSGLRAAAASLGVDGRRYTRCMFQARSFKHCKACGGAVAYQVPPGDNRDRAICTVRGLVHYENPLVVVGTVPIWGDEVLLCKRNIEPRYGLWTLPAGFLELGETVTEGAARETVEEAGARIELQELYTVIDVVPAGQVHLFYRAQLQDTQFAPGPESIEARLFTEDAIPWDEIAFRTVRETLKYFFADRRRGVFELHCGAIG